MDFVDDVDFEWRSGGADRRVGSQMAYRFYSIVACSVDFDHVHIVTRVDRQGDLGALIETTGSVRRCVEGFGEDPSGAGFADPSSSGEQISVTDAVGLDCSQEPLGDGVLADKFLEGFGSIATGHDGVLAGRVGIFGVG